MTVPSHSRGVTNLMLLLTACATKAAMEPVPAARDANLTGPPHAVAQQALKTLPSGHTVSWRRIGSDTTGLVRPVRTFRTAYGFCREYAIAAQAPDGSAQVWHEVACRNRQGAWQTP